MKWVIGYTPRIGRIERNLDIGQILDSQLLILSKVRRGKGTMEQKHTFILSLKDVEMTIRQSDAIESDKKAELLRLLSTLQSEIVALEPAHAEHAARVVGFTERSMHEAIRQTKDPQLIALATQGLSASVEELEVSHPQLVQVVNAISMLLSNMGI